MIPPKCFEQTLEQQLKLRLINDCLEELTAEEMRELVRDLSIQLDVKDNIIKHLMAQSLSI
jgi:uncharacterized protein YaaW (UPF0174 family)